MATINIEITTTGTLSPVVLQDLGQLTLNHPATLNIGLLYGEDRLASSASLQSALDSGHLTLTQDVVTPVTEVSQLGRNTGGAGTPPTISDAVIQADPGGNSALRLVTVTGTDLFPESLLTITSPTGLTSGGDPVPFSSQELGTNPSTTDTLTYLIDVSGFAIGSETVLTLQLSNPAGSGELSRTSTLDTDVLRGGPLSPQSIDFRSTSATTLTLITDFSQSFRNEQDNEYSLLVGDNTVVLNRTVNGIQADAGGANTNRWFSLSGFYENVGNIGGPAVGGRFSIVDWIFYTTSSAATMYLAMGNHDSDRFGDTYPANPGGTFLNTASMVTPIVDGLRDDIRGKNAAGSTVIFAPAPTNLAPFTANRLRINFNTGDFQIFAIASLDPADWDNILQTTYNASGLLSGVGFGQDMHTRKAAPMVYLRTGTTVAWAGVRIFYNPIV